MITKKSILELLKLETRKNWYLRVDDHMNDSWSYHYDSTLKKQVKVNTPYRVFKLKLEPAGNCDSGSMFTWCIGINRYNEPYIIQRHGSTPVTTETLISVLQFLKAYGIKKGMLK